MFIKPLASTPSTSWLLAIMTGLVCIVQNTANAQDTPAGTAPKTNATSNQANAEARQAAVAKVSLSLANELRLLIPGDEVEGSRLQKALDLAVEAFIKRNAAKAKMILEQERSEDSIVPPADVLMAGLAFAAKDVNSGGRFLQLSAIAHPNHPSVYAAHGRIALASGRNVDALLHFEKLKEILDNRQLEDVVRRHYEGEYLEGMVQAASRLEKYDLARQLIGPLREREPESAQPLQILAEIAFKEGKVDECLQVLQELRKLQPETRVPEVVIGAWFARKGDTIKANDWFDQILVKYADQAKPLLEYANWSMSQENFSAAQSAIELAEKASQPTTVSRSMKAKIAFANQKFDDAVAGYEALVTEKPDNSDFSNMLALSMIESRSTANKARANQLASKNLQANPNNRVALAAAGYIRMQTLGVNPTVKGIFQKVAQTRDGRSPEVDYFLVKFLEKAGNQQAAAQLLQQALKFKGLFLYRRQAQQLETQLTSGNLPTQ